jgi:hypothetical protein
MMDTQAEETKRETGKSEISTAALGRPPLQAIHTTLLHHLARVE